MKNTKINLAVIFYGDKSQVKINQIQFDELAKNLSSFKLRKYDFNKGEYPQLIKDFKAGKVDVVLKNSYGRGNEVHIESLLELFGIPYLGSDSRATLVGTSKLLSKHIFRLNNLPVAKDIYVNSDIYRKSKNNILSEVRAHIKYPCIVKDIYGTDSRGIYFAKNRKELVSILSKSLRKHNGMIIEEYIGNATEVTCMVVGNEKPMAYEPAEIRKEKSFLTGEDKDAGLLNLNIPADLPKSLINKIKKTAELTHQALGCKTFSRVDILVKDNKMYILEVDVHPGFKLSSPTIKSAKYRNQTPNELFLNFYKSIK